MFKGMIALTGELSKRQELCEEALNSMGSIVIIDKNYKIVFMSDLYAKALNLDPKESIGIKVTDVIPDSRLALVLETGKPEIASFFTYKSGQTLVVNRVPIINKGEIIGAVGFSTFANIDEIEKSNKKIAELSNEAKYYKSELQLIRGSKFSLEQIISVDPHIIELKNLVKRISQTKSTILINGESGTGKELFAHSIHQLSPRNHSPFVRLNCAAIPESLIETELFGYAEGSFTGAKRGGSIGKFELANGGTLLLDEINSMPLSMQSKLLRAIQEKEIQKVGSLEPIEVDVRLIVTTNQDLLDLVKAGTFREDLYYRINVVEIKIPPLRERMGDIRPLVSHLIPKLNKELGINITGIEPAVLDLFKKYTWPGNIRELENCIERASNSALTGALMLEHFDFLRDRLGVSPSPDEAGILSLQKSKENAEKRTIIQAIKQAKGNKKLAAEMLEIDRTILYDKIKKYEIFINDNLWK